MTSNTSPIYVFEPVPIVFGTDSASKRFGNSGKRKTWHIKPGFKELIKQIKNDSPDATIILLNGIKPSNSPTNDRRESARKKPLEQLTNADVKVLNQMRDALSTQEAEFRFANAFKGEDPELVAFITKDAQRWIYTCRGDVLDQVAELKSIIDPENERDVILYYKDPLAKSSSATQHWVRAQEFSSVPETPLVPSI